MDCAQLYLRLRYYQNIIGISRGRNFYSGIRLPLFDAPNRNGISDVKPLQYQIDFDTLRYTYIPNLEDIKNDKEASEIAEEAKDDFMEVF